MSSYRPRRSRIYGANYDMSERYYKKQLDDLDNKRLPSSTSRFGDSYLNNDFLPKDDKILTPKVSFLHDEPEDEPIIPKYVPRKKPIFDDFDEDIIESKLKSRTSLAKYDALNDSLFDDELPKRDVFKKVFDRPSRAKSYLDDMDDQAEGFTATRRIKIRSENIIMGDKSAETSSRMKATKARLADLESEMMSITDKQNEREKRKFNLKKLLNESDSDSFKALE